MRPFTAEENFNSIPRTLPWDHRSTSPRAATDFEQKQVRNLMQSQNVHAFLNKSLMSFEKDSLNSMSHLSRREVLDEITLIKSKFNLSKKRFSVDDNRLKVLERISKEVIIEEKICSQRNNLLEQRTQNLIKSIKMIKEKQEECQQNMLVYSHILERTKRSQIYLQIRRNFLKRKIRKSENAVQEEERTSFRHRETKSCTQNIYRLLHEVVSSETREKRVVVEKINKDMEIRDFMKSRREERKRRFAEIAEIAANEDQDKRQTCLREGLMLNKLWASFLSSKLALQIQKNSHIEQAFIKIRSVTGEYNINELVHKFLTRENTFKELKYTIDCSRVSISELNRRNSEIAKVIKAAAIHDKESRAADAFSLKERHAASQKRLESEKMKLKDMNAKYQHILSWSSRMLGLFQANSPEAKTVFDQFKALSSMICGRLGSIKLSKADEFLITV